MFFNACKTNKLIEAINRNDWTLVISLCEASPLEHSCKMAKQWCRLKLSGDRVNTVMLPLHYIIIMSDGSDECWHAINAIIKVDPHALECKESSLARTPLHLACLLTHIDTRGCERLIRLVLHANPDISMDHDRLLRLPLHYAAANTHVGYAIHDLLEANPEATTTRDGQGWLPLHVACHYKTSIETIKALVEINPDAVVAMTPMDHETPVDLIRKQSSHGFPDKHRILDFVQEKAKHYVPTPMPFMDSFVSDNFIHTIY